GGSCVFINRSGSAAILISPSRTAYTNLTPISPRSCRTMVRLRLFFASVLLAGTALSQDVAAPKPPTAKKVPHKIDLNGDTRTDDYFWLKDKTNKEVIKHLEAENAYTKAMTNRL